MSAESTPTARALLALQCIQRRPGITARELADELGVSDRAARRYAAILRQAGVPVEGERGPFGGYRLGRSVRLAPMSFTASEALGLVMAALDGHHDAADPHGPVGSALDKLMSALPAAVVTPAERVRRTARAARDRAAVRADPAIISAVVEACAARHRVRIDYRSEAGTAWTEEVDPWAVVVRHGRWYLLCWSVGRGARRAYRIDRVGAVQQLNVDVEPPIDLDPVRALEEHLAEGWEYPVEVHVEAPIERIRWMVSGALGRLEAVDDEHCRVIGSTSEPVWYAEQLARIRVPFRVVAGPEVRQALAELAGRLAGSVDRPAGR